MGATAGDYLCERLPDRGVSVIYGFPGTASTGSWACGHAKFTGEAGVCKPGE